MSLPDVVLLDDALPPIVIEDDAGRQLEIITDSTGPKGDDGQSAYELAVAAGFVGTVEQWLDSLDGRDGGEGLSAYGLAVAAGFAGTVEEWLASLRGADGEGADGSDGQSAYDLAVASGFMGTAVQWLASLKGADGEDGISAYEVALEEGFAGTPEEWLESLRGPRGYDGADSTVPGPPGSFDPTELEANIAAVADDLLGVAEVVDGVQGALVTANQNLDGLFLRIGDHDTMLLNQDARLDLLEAGGGGGGGTPQRQAVAITGATGPGSVEMAPAFTILSIAYSGPARLRLFRTAAGRDADAGRPVGVAYPGGRGRFYEYVALGAELDAEGSVAGSTETGDAIYYQVDAGVPVDITITYLRSE